MDSQGDHDDDEFSWDPNGMAPNLGLDFFSQPPCFPLAESSSGGQSGRRLHGASGVEGLDLNSEAVDITDNMSYLDLLRSSPAGLVGDGERGCTRRGGVRTAARGAGSASGRGAGRGTGRAAGRGRGTGRAAAAPTTEPAGSSVHRAAPNCHPASTVTRQFRPPHPPGGRVNTAGAADAAFNGGVQDPTSCIWSQNPYDEEGDDHQEIDASNDGLFDKADWANSANNAIFCELCVEEIRDGNSNKGHLTNRGYRNIAAKFEERTGLRHSKQQLKNRWDALRRMYSFWLWMNKQSDLGRNKGTVLTDDEWWKTHTKGHSEWRKLRHGPPENLDELEVMFQNIAVDGSSSCIPGEQMTEGYEGDNGDGDVGDGSPITTPTAKRTNSTCTTATSPRKKTKSPMVKVMKGIWETMQKNCAVAEKAMQGDFTFESVQQCMRLAVESGAVEGTDEHWMACKLFVKAEHRAVFLSLTSKEARLDFLKRWCREKRNN
ncbi:unnamed protein product [Urochloa humidicola]